MSLVGPPTLRVSPEEFMDLWGYVEQNMRHFSPPRAPHPMELSWNGTRVVPDASVPATVRSGIMTRGLGDDLSSLVDLCREARAGGRA